MHNFKEDLLQFIWQYKLLKPGPYTSISGKEIHILHPGELNVNSGPDFFNSRIKINELTLAGNIEVHIRTSDWSKHKHEQDKSYDNIILHVVYEHDKQLEQNSSHNVEVVEIKKIIPEGVIEQYSGLVQSKTGIACAPMLHRVEDLKYQSWLQRMYIERLESKIYIIQTIFENCGNNYGQTFYFLLLRNFGFRINALPFEMLAKQLPLQILLRHSENLMQLESLLFGMAGMLEEQQEDSYLRNLQNEFAYLSRIYKLIPLRNEIFKFSRLRPSNFPSLRLAQLAQLFHLHPQLFQSPQLYLSEEKIMSCFEKPVENYWSTHYRPGGKVQKSVLKFGRQSIENLLINTFAPFFFFYGKKNNNEELQNEAFRLLENCRFELNRITAEFQNKIPEKSNAADSQGMIHLFQNYCLKRACLKCSVAGEILKCH